MAGGGGDFLRSRFPDWVQVLSVPEAGHALLPEQPDLVLEAVLSLAEGWPFLA